METSTTTATENSPAAAPVVPPKLVEDSDKIVADILFAGNSLNKSKSLEKKIKTRRQQKLDRKKISTDIKTLFETGDFDDVTADVVDLSKSSSKGKPLVKIIFTVQERSIIKRVDYKGNKKIKPSAFDEKIQSKEGNPYDRFKASLDERAILEHYRDEGYANAQVEHFTTVDSKNKKLILTFFIKEGERVMVESVHIQGSQQYKEKTLLKKIKSRKKKVFKDEFLREDRTSLLDFYLNHGHLDVDLSTPAVVINMEKNTAQITYYLNEGAHYTYSGVKFEGATIFNEKELRKAWTIKKGHEFQQAKLDESMANLKGLYDDKGYLRTEIHAEPERSSGTVSYKIDILESSIVYVDGVYVDGNSYTKEYVIKREVLLRPGDVFSASRMRRSVEKIYNLGFLEDVQVDVQQPRDPNLADLIFNVKEGKPGIFSMGAGFSSVDRFVGTLQLQHQNLFGRGQRLDLSYEFGSRRQNLELGWTDPWFLGYKMSGGIDLFDTVRVRDYPGVRSAFREKRRGVGTRLGPRLTDDLSLLFSYTIQTTEIFGVDDSIKQDLFPTFGVPKNQAQTTDSVSQIKSSVLSEISYDNRDNRFDATHGVKSAASVELAGGPFGGDINYYKPQLNGSVYIPTFWKFVLSFSARASWVNTFSPSEDVPSSERFYLGGPDTVRGYDTNSIVPRTIEHDQYGIEVTRSIPGRIMTLLNAEYKFPIVQEHNRTIFQGAFFLDVGGSWLRTQDIDFATGSLDSRMKAGVGFGFRFKTPVFPIRLDFGIPLNPRRTDSTRQGDAHGLQPYFTIGNIF